MYERLREGRGRAFSMEGKRKYSWKSEGLKEVGSREQFQETRVGKVI